MKQATIGTSFLVILLTSSALAQTPDTTSAWRYFPLEVGNVWEYDDYEEQCDLDGHCDGPTHFQSVRWWVRGESLVDDVRYFDLRVNTFTPDGALLDGPFDHSVRFDTASARLVAYESGLDIAFNCPFDSTFDEDVACSSGVYTVSGSYEESVTIGDESFPVTRKFYRRNGPEFTGFDFVPGIGLVFEKAGGTAPFFEWTRYLTYARVGGEEYGEAHFPVASEGTPQPSAVTLAVFPNPSRGIAAVRFSLDTPQRVTLAVYDVLGRRVLSRDLGAQPAGEASHRLDLAALPAGVYVVRLVGDAGARATARIVRH